MANESKLNDLDPEQRNEYEKLKEENVAAGEEELYNPVKCVKCTTQVAVFDKDEVYHFFNVVASHS